MTADGSGGAAGRSEAPNDADNRGRPPPPRVSGDAVGSGAGAGGGGGPEEYDGDPQAGGGRMPHPAPPTAPDKGPDAPSHGSR